MKKFFFVCFSFIAFNSHAQNKVIDSLKLVLKTSKGDTTHVNTLNALSLKYLNTGKPDSSFYFANESKALAEKISFKKGLGDALHIIGINYYSKGNFPEALKTFSNSLKIRTEITDLPGMANSHTNLGTIYIVQGNFAEAQKEVSSALKIQDSLHNKTGIANCYNSLGNILTNQGNYPAAITNYLSASRLYVETNNKLGVANGFNNIGVCYQYQGLYEKALEFHNKALKTRLENNDKNGIYLSYLNLGYISSQTSNYPEAIRYYLAALKIAEERQDKRGIATINNNLGIVYQEQGDMPTATKMQSNALTMMLELGDKTGIGQAYMNLGALNITHGKFQEALKNFKDAIKIYEENGDKKNLALCYNNIAIYYQYLGNFPLTLQYHQKSLKLKEETNDKKGLSESYHNIGTIYFNQGNYQEALKNIHKSFELLRQMGDKKGLAIAYNSLGNISKESGNYEEALKNYRISFQLKDSIGEKNGIATSYNNIGETYLLQKKYPQAIETLNEGLKTALDAGDKMLQAVSYINISRTYFESGNNNEAKQYGYLALKISNELLNPEYMKRSNEVLARVFIKENNLKEAEKYVVAALEISNKNISINFPILSEKEQELYFNTVSPSFMTFNDFALKRKPSNPAITEAVYNTAIRNKGLLLKSSTAMRTAILKSNDSALIERYKNWLALKKQIAKLYSEGKEAKELEEKSNVAEKDLAKNSQLFSDFNKARNLTWKDVKKSLKPKEAAIEFIHFSKTSSNDSLHEIVYCAVIVKPNSIYPEMIELFKGKELEELLGKFNENNNEYIEIVYGTKNSPNSNLYNLIWKPMEKVLTNINTVYLSPSGLLHKIAFASLNKGPNIYLCDNYKLNIQTSTGKVAQPENFILNKNTRVTLFGGIDYSSDVAKADSNSYLAWNYLLGTKTEAEKIAGILKTSSIPVNIFEAKTASENEFKNSASNSTILHIATHGFFFPDPEETKKLTDPEPTPGSKETSRSTENGFGYWSFIKAKNPLMRSGLVFAGANAVWKLAEQTGSEDGVLTAQEVANIDLQKTDLVVLSACETGLGDIKGSEGVYGLQRSFKMAGAKFLIMSLWQVPDAETEEFMVNFYENLITIKNVKTAFTKTQTAMRKKYDPFFWAPFVLLE